MSTAIQLQATIAMMDFGLVFSDLQFSNELGKPDFSVKSLYIQILGKTCKSKTKQQGGKVLYVKCGSQATCEFCPASNKYMHLPHPALLTLGRQAPLPVNIISHSLQHTCLVLIRLGPPLFSQNKSTHFCGHPSGHFCILIHSSIPLLLL